MKGERIAPQREEHIVSIDTALENAQRLGILTEIASQMSDIEWNAFVTAETARRNYSAKPFEINDRVRFVATTRPKKIALLEGTIIERKVYGGEWLYKMKLDYNGMTYVRVKRASLEAI